MDSISTESLLNAVLKIYFVMRSKLAFMRNLLTCKSDFRKNHASLQVFST